MLSRVSVVLGLCFVAGISHVFSERIRYDNYPLYKVVPSDKSQLDELVQMQRYSDSLIFLQDLDMPKKDIGVIVAPHKVNDFLEMLKIKKIQHEVVEVNFQNILDEEIAENEEGSKEISFFDSGKAYSWTNYQTVNDTHRWMIDLCGSYPAVVQLMDAGVSYERRRILGIKISTDKFKTNKPGIFLEAGMHAREWIGPATVTYIANALLKSNNAAIKALAHKYNWYIIPIANPDGYEYSHITNRLWRKTRSPQAGSCFGADPNRNWDFHWGEKGVSKNPCDKEYPGSKPFSEIETLSLSRFLASMKGKIQLYVAFHAFSQLLLYPYGFTAKKAPNDADLKHVYKVTVDALSKRYGTKYTGGNIYDAIYPASGSSMEWVYGVQDVKMAYTYELRPKSNSLIGFRLPPAQIIPTAEETLDSMVAMVNEVEKLGYFKKH